MSNEAMANRDTKAESRKGRKPTGGKAMTPAERKRKQRQREREAKSKLPSWLRLRHSLWRVIQQQFMFADVDELCNALKALNAALGMVNAYRSTPEMVANCQESLLFYMNPDKFPKDRDFFSDLFPELKAYQFDDQHFANRKGTILIDILRDLIESHENKSEGDE